MRRRPRQLLIAVVATWCVGCGTSVQQTRLTDDPPKDEREHRAAARTDPPECPPAIGWVVPGFGQICYGKPVEGATLSALTATELSAAYGLYRSSDPASDRAPHSLPILGLQNIWVYAISDLVRERQLADAKRYVPREHLGHLAAAPFDIGVLKRPSVWAGILGTTGAALGAAWLLDPKVDGADPQSPPEYFGGPLEPAATYATAGASGAAVFTHVAIGEEMLYRGLIQSGLTRATGRTGGWLLGSAAFAAAHAPNAIFLPPEQRLQYLTLSLPVTAAVGTYFGATYRWNDYSLAPPVAVHFWYDFLVSAAQFALVDRPTPIGTTFSIRF